MNKMKRYAWACSQIREYIDNDSYGSLHIIVDKGNVMYVKKEFTEKPPIDIE